MFTIIYLVTPVPVSERFLAVPWGEIYLALPFISEEGKKALDMLSTVIVKYNTMEHVPKAGKVRTPPTNNPASGTKEEARSHKENEL